MADKKNWLQLPAYATGSINQANIYFAAVASWLGAAFDRASGGLENSRDWLSTGLHFRLIASRM